MSRTTRMFDAHYLDAMINSLSDMVRVITREGKVAYANQAYERKFGNGKDVIGTFCYELYGNDDTCSPCIASQVMQTGKMRQVTRHIGNRTYTLSVSPLYNPQSGDLIGTVEVYRDITLDFNIRNNVVAQNTKLRHELQMAQCVQDAFVRNVLPDVEGYKLAAGYFPCEAVGGDIYDCILRDNHMLLYVADACGHGVMPAMLSIFFSRTVRAACLVGCETPADILAYVQKEFVALQLPDDIYITSFAVMIDLDTGRFLYSNAGLSVEPIVAHDGRARVLSMGAPPISCWQPRRERVNAKDALEPSDRLLLYTDGNARLQTSEEALQSMYSEFCVPDFDPGDFIRMMRRDIVTKTDDMTILICSRAPETEGA